MSEVVLHDQPRSLELLSSARLALAEANTLDDVKRIRDTAEALRVYAKQSDESLAIQNECTEIRMRAERRAGELLATMPKHPGGRPTETPDIVSEVSVPPKLTELGISHKQSERWQQVAEVPEPVFEEHVAATKDSGEELTTAGLLRKAKNMDVHYSSATDEWATPQDFFDVVNAEFGFDLDVCALDTSAKAARYFTPDDDGLTQDWTGVCWMNPPYGNEIAEWVAKARASADAGATVVCLVPARVDTGWWWDHCRYGEIRFLRGRLRFGDAEASAPFPSALVVFGPEPKVVWWEWK